jgi:hypothetical protein
MQLKLSYILASFALRPRKPERQCLIDDPAIASTDAYKRSLTWIRDPAYERVKRIAGPWPRNPHNRDGGGWPPRGQRVNGFARRIRHCNARKRRDRAGVKPYGKLRSIGAAGRANVDPMTAST